ncbi:hypothetical protein T11_7861, partial [Trichinella zimbabwensis]
MLEIPELRLAPRTSNAWICCAQAYGSRTPSIAWPRRITEPI